MRHRLKTKQLGRNTKQRQALFKSLVRNLILNGSITTTQAKAKVVQPIAEKLITKSKTDSVVARRHLHEFFGKRDAVNTLVDRIAPVFKNRTSGYTRIVMLGNRRGDNAEVVRIELVDKPGVLSTLKKPVAADIKAAKAAKSKAKKTAEKAEKTETKEPKEAEKPKKSVIQSVKAVAEKATKATNTNILARKSGKDTRSIAASKKK